MNVSEAIHKFEEMAEGYAIKPDTTLFSGAGLTVSVVRVGTAELRLTADENAGSVRLEISHGPVEGAPSGWALLHDAKCSGGVLREPAESQEGLLSAVAYGLELMCPSA